MSKPLRPWWHELNTWQPQAALAFYGRTLGWEFEAVSLPDGSTYWIGRRHGVPVGGVMALNEAEHAGIDDHWMTYMTVDHIDRAVDAALAAGGSIVRPAVEVPGLGSFAVLADAAGALIGVMEPAADHVVAVRSKWPATHDFPRPVVHTEPTGEAALA